MGWTNYVRVALQPSFYSAKVPGGVVKHPPVFQAYASIGVYLEQFLSSAGRLRNIIGGIVNAGSVRNRRAVSLIRRFVWIVIGGRCSSVLSASATVVLCSAD